MPLFLLQDILPLVTQTGRVMSFVFDFTYRLLPNRVISGSEEFLITWSQRA